MKGTITRVGAIDSARATNNPLVSSPVHSGHFRFWPRVGYMFLFDLDPTPTEMGKTVNTTQVLSTKFENGRVRFTTRNSIYEVAETPAITPVTYFPAPKFKVREAYVAMRLPNIEELS